MSKLSLSKNVPFFTVSLCNSHLFFHTITSSFSSNYSSRNFQRKKKLKLSFFNCLDHHVRLEVTCFQLVGSPSLEFSSSSNYFSSHACTNLLVLNCPSNQNQTPFGQWSPFPYFCIDKKKKIVAIAEQVGEQIGKWSTTTLSWGRGFFELWRWFLYFV